MTTLKLQTDRPVVLVPVDEYERMRETIEILSNPETVKTIKRGRKEFAEGKTVELEEFWRKEMDEKHHYPGLIDGTKPDL